MPTPGANRLVFPSDLTAKSGAPVLRAFIDAENFRRKERNLSPLPIRNRKIKADMYHDLVTAFENDLLSEPLDRTPSAPRDHSAEWTGLEDIASEHTSKFARQA